MINQCLSGSGTINLLLKARAQNETKWIKRVFDISGGRVATIPFKSEA